MSEPPAQPGITVMLVDDHQVVRDGLKARLGDVPEISVVGDVATARQALELAPVLAPSLALVDVSLPDMSGIELTGALAERVPATRVLILSMYDNREYVGSALAAGASGYVLKDAPSLEIIAAIKCVAGGGVYFSSAVAAAFGPSGLAPPLLTDREREVLILLAQGDSNKHVARKLNVSVRTVETHRLNLRRKLGIDTSAGLTRYAIQQGWIRL